MREKIKQYFGVDLTKKQAYVILVIIFVYYPFVTFFTEMFTDECTGLEECFDFHRRMARLAVWDLEWLHTDFRHNVHMGLLVFSGEMFNNYKILSLASSVLLLFVCYLFTKKITGMRLAGIIALLVMLNSWIFTNYDTSVTYPTFWALLFMVALYLSISKEWWLSPIPYLISIPAKSLTALYMPGFLLFLFIEKKYKLILMYFGLIAVGFVLVFTWEPLSEKTLGGFWLFSHFDLEDFMYGFVSWFWKGFANDQVTLLLFIVSSFMILFNRKVVPHASSMLVLSASMVFISPILIGMTTYDVWPYRMVPLVVLTATMVGMMITNLHKFDVSMFFTSLKASSSNLENQEQKPHDSSKS